MNQDLWDEAVHRTGADREFVEAGDIVKMAEQIERERHASKMYRKREDRCDAHKIMQENLLWDREHAREDATLDRGVMWSLAGIALIVLVVAFLIGQALG